MGMIQEQKVTEKEALDRNLPKIFSIEEEGRRYADVLEKAQLCEELYRQKKISLRSIDIKGDILNNGIESFISALIISEPQNLLEVLILIRGIFDRVRIAYDAAEDKAQQKDLEQALTLIHSTTVFLEKELGLVCQDCGKEELTWEENSLIGLKRSYFL